MHVFATLFLLLGAAQAGAQGQTTSAPRPAAQSPSAAQPSYQIGPQDELKITVFDADELSGSYRVDNDGFITFPLLGRIAVGGTSLGETQDKLRTMLSNGYIRNPQIRVDVGEYKSQSIFVSGEVRTPAELRMTGTMTLLRALAQAGSPLSSASSELTVARQERNAAGVEIEGTASTDVIRVNWRDLMGGRA